MSHGMMSIHGLFSCNAFVTSADAISHKVGHTRPEIMKLQFAVCMCYSKMSSIHRVVAIIKYAVAHRSWYH